MYVSNLYILCWKYLQGDVFVKIDTNAKCYCLEEFYSVNKFFDGHNWDDLFWVEFHTQLVNSVIRFYFE